MYLNKIYIKNYKLYEEQTIKFNKDCNIFVGNNNSGKSTILEALQIILTGRIDWIPFDNKIKSNIFNNKIRKEFVELLKKGNTPLKKLPEIIIEVFFSVSEKDNTNQALTLKQKLGNNNYLREIGIGIQMKLSYDSDYSETIIDLINQKLIEDIPVEFYKAEWTYFNSEPIKTFRQIPIKTALIDTTKKEYGSYLNRFINNSMTEYLSNTEHKNLSLAYHTLRTDFDKSEEIITLNKKIKEANISSHNVKFIATEPERNEWKDDISISVDNIPFDNLGFGSQNLIKLGLAVKEKAENFGIILFEEPENNLSFSNMSKLIKTIKSTENQQKFVTTHNSYVANNLNLRNLTLLNKGIPVSFKSISEETMDYFLKLPGYNTLRMFLANKSILVEGPSDELIVQRAYFDEYTCLPIEDCTDIISVRALAFKRYLELGIIAKTNTIVITDNDGDIEKLKSHYKGFLEYINYEMNETLYTLEPSIVDVNFKEKEDAIKFISIIKNKTVQEIKDKIKKTYNEWDNPVLKTNIIDWMTTPSNKTKWSLRVFNSQQKIKYPKYIKDAIIK